MSIAIIRCDATQDGPWNRFVETCPHASFYHRAEWRGINEKCFGHRTAYLAAVEGERVVGVFPFVQLKSLLFGNLACSLPFVNYGGPAGETAEIEQALLEAGASVAAEWGVEYLEIRSQRFLGERFPSSDHKVSMTVTLASDSDKLWNAYKSNHRNEIRKGYKNGLSARIGGGELLDDFYKVLSESWRDHGTPIYSREYIETIASTFGDAIRVSVVYAGDEPAAAAFDGLHGGTIEGMWMGLRNKFRAHFASYVLYWELIKNGCERGFQRFHLGRSTVQSGGEVFKRKWNAEAVQLHWHYILLAIREIPQLNVDNPRYRFAIGAWRRLPVPVTQIIGPLIARSIP